MQNRGTKSDRSTRTALRRTRLQRKTGHDAAYVPAFSSGRHDRLRPPGASRHRSAREPNTLDMRIGTQISVDRRGCAPLAADAALPELTERLSPRQSYLPVRHFPKWEHSSRRGQFPKRNRDDFAAVGAAHTGTADHVRAHLESRPDVRQIVDCGTDHHRVLCQYWATRPGQRGDAGAIFAPCPACA